MTAQHLKILAYSVFLSSASFAAEAAQVDARVEETTIPTYKIRPAETAPIFDRTYMYQRARRAIYPYSLNDNMNTTGKKEDVSYKAVVLENKYIKICVIPELGGRLFYAIDKTNNYDFFYRQDVVKPANVGMNGAWISGGVEWNVFHHHRITSQEPCDYKLVENPDGSKTVWVGETERRHRMSWAIGLTVFPDKSYIKVDGRLINSTQNSNSMLFWANAATHANENYQIIFPQNTEFGCFHAKNSFCHWPVSREPFNGTDEYKNGIRVDLWKAHPVGNSIFAFDRKEDFIAGYDHGKDAGTMMYADRHISAGGKFWSWGPNSGWPTKILTDTAGHYVELMMGAYSDNQPDYNWSYPYEVKTFTQYYYALRNIGGAKMASKEATLNLEKTGDGKISVGVNTTEKLDALKLVVKVGGKTALEKTFDASPAKPFTTSFSVDEQFAESDMHAELFDSRGGKILEYSPIEKDLAKPLPETVKTPPPPEEIENTEECFLVGLRNLQFHNGFINPLDYFAEVLRRDPSDTRTNTILGAYWRERGDYAKAEKHLRTAIARLTKDYTRPKDCEAIYNLGVLLKETGRTEEAVDMLFRAVWSYAFNSAANTQLAQIFAARGDFESALERLGEALDYNARNLPALNLEASILRKTGKSAEAKKLIARALKLDPINAYAMREAAILDGDSKGFETLMRDQPESYIELASDYARNGFEADAAKLLKYIDAKTPYPTVKMWLGYFADKNGDRATAKKYFEAALALPFANVFRLETANVLKKMAEYTPNNWKIQYYLGNVYYDKNKELGLSYWKKAAELNPKSAETWRNIGYAYRHHFGDLNKAREAYLKAVELNPQAIYIEEFDEVLAKQNADVKFRFEILRKHHDIASKRYAPSVAEIETATLLGKYDYALDLLRNGYYPTGENVANFHDVYTDTLLMAGNEKVSKGEYAEGIKLMREAFEYPENHQVFLYDTRVPRDAQVYYYIALAYEKSGDSANAQANYKKASEVSVGKTDFRFYKARALEKLGRKSEAKAIFSDMVESGKSGIVKRFINNFVDGVHGDLTGTTAERINAAARYTQGLGELGLGDKAAARAAFEESDRLRPNSLWTIEMLREAR